MNTKKRLDIQPDLGTDERLIWSGRGYLSRQNLDNSGLTVLGNKQRTGGNMEWMVNL
jgi:hypothetical protein